MRVCLAHALLLASCFDSAATTCGDLVCPPDLTCAPDGSRCVSRAQVDACSGKADGDPCTAQALPGTCSGGSCAIPFCGDGVREGTEECDGADLGLAPDGQINDCTTIPRAFYNRAGLACTSACTFDTAACTGFCGDGITDGPEACDGSPPPGRSCLDYGYDVGHLTCSPLCTPELGACGYLGWTRVSSIAVAADFRGIWSSSQHDVYVVGQAGNPYYPLVEHFDGTSWTQTVLPTPTGAAPLMGVSGTGPNDVFAASWTGMYHWDGTTWNGPQSVMGALLNGVWAVAPGNVYAIANGGAIAHFDGAAWSAMASGTTVDLTSIWARGPTEIWVTGEMYVPSSNAYNSIVLRSTGASWSPVAGTSTSSLLLGVHGFGATDVYLSDFQNGISRWNGTSWQGPYSRFFAGAIGGQRVAFDATSSYGVAILAPDALHWLQTAPSLGYSSGNAMTNDPGGHLWVAGRQGYVGRYRGTSWASTELNVYYFPAAVWGSGDGSIFGVGFGGCAVYRGGQDYSSPVACSTAEMLAVWGTSSTNVYAVGTNGAIVHSVDGNGASWSTMPSGTTRTLWGIWGSGTTDMYAVGTAGSVVHSSGATWTAVPLGTTADLFGVWGTAATDVWVVGAAGTIFHFDGTSWSPSASGVTTTLHAVWGLGPADVWAVGEGGTILHFDGATWRAIDSGTSIELDSVWGTGPNDVFAGGQSSVLLHFHDGFWSPVRFYEAGPNPGTASLRSMWGDGRRLYFGGAPDILDRTSYPAGGCPAQPAPGVATKETSCNDAIDDDCDFLVDCDDPDCQADPACGP